MTRKAANTQPAFCTARVLVLGVGNTLFGDDGFGPAVADHLTHNYGIPDDIYVMDAGTGVRKLLVTLALSDTLPEEVIILDAVDRGKGDGNLSEIPLEELPASKMDDFSLHQMPASNMLLELKKRGRVDVTVVACDVGVVPQVIQPGLSPATRRAVIAASRHVARRLGLHAIR
jgi:coenzyme F420 hydrogenase subunit delta